MPSASLCVRKLSQHQFNANVEFVTRATRLARVIFLGSRELSTIDGNNHPFNLIRRIQARVVLGFHGIIGVSLNLIIIIGTLSKNVLLPKVCNINFLIEKDNNNTSSKPDYYITALLCPWHLQCDWI